jgi:hypothetical protein
LELEPKKGKQKLAAKEQKITYFKASERDEQNHFFVELCGKERERESITIGLSLEDISRGSGFLRSSRRFFFPPTLRPSLFSFLSISSRSCVHLIIRSAVVFYLTQASALFSCLQLYVSSV